MTNPFPYPRSVSRGLKQVVTTMFARAVYAVRCVAMFTYVTAGLLAFPVVLAGKMVADRETEVDATVYRPIVIRATQVAIVVALVVGAYVG